MYGYNSLTMRQCAVWSRNQTTRAGEIAVRHFGITHDLKGKEVTPTFYPELKGHLKARNLSICGGARVLDEVFDMGKSPSSKIADLCASGRIFVPCLRKGYVLHVDHEIVAAEFFRYCQATPILMRKWSRVMPVSSGKGYVQPARFDAVVALLN